MSKTRLMRGNCLSLMTKIEDRSVDMVLCDLPYGTTECAWDSVIPFDLLWEQYERIITDRGAIVLFGAQPFTTALIASNLELYKYSWVWEKTRPSNFLNAKNAPMKIYEDVMVFSKGTTANKSPKLMNYFPQGLRATVGNTSKTSSKTEKFSYYGKRPSREGKEWVQEFTNYPKNILRFESEKNPNHPTQKPVRLCEYLIKTYTTVGMTVLDNTMGSGTSGVAAVRTRRNFVGIEMSKEYFELSKARIADAKTIVSMELNLGI